MRATSKQGQHGDRRLEVRCREGIEGQDVGDDPLCQPGFEAHLQVFGGPGDDRVQFLGGQRGGNVEHAPRLQRDLQQFGSQGGQPGVEVVAHDEDHVERGVGPDRPGDVGERLKGLRSGGGCEEFLELVDDQHHAVVGRVGGQQPGHGRPAPRSSGSGQAGLFEGSRQVRTRPRDHLAPAVAARQPPGSQRGQHPRLDQRGLPRPGGPEQQHHPPPARQARHHPAHRLLAAPEPAGVLGRERLQRPARRHVAHFERGPRLPQHRGRSGVGDALAPVVAVGDRDRGEHAHHQAGRLVEDRPAAEPGGQIVGPRQLQQVTGTVGARQHRSGRGEPEVPARRSLRGEAKRANPVPAAARRRSQRQRGRARRHVLQPYQGDVLLPWVAPSVLQHPPPHRRDAGHTREDQRHHITGTVRAVHQDVRAADQQILGDQEARPHHRPVPVTHLGDSSSQNIGLGGLVPGVHRISSRSRRSSRGRARCRCRPCATPSSPSGGSWRPSW